MKRKLYIRICKTGSTSLSTAFNRSVIEVTASKKYKKVFEKYSYDYRFTFIRNPYDRIVSAYNMLIKSSKAKDFYKAFDKKDIIDIPFNDFLHKILEYRESYRELGLEKEKNIHLRPWRKKREIRKNRYACEVFWLLAHTESMVDSIEYFIPVSELDFIGRFESLNDDYNSICRYLGTDSKLPQLNVSKNRKKYIDYYDDESLELVTGMYRDDIETFNYSFGQ